MGALVRFPGQERRFASRMTQTSSGWRKARCRALFELVFREVGLEFGDSMLERIVDAAVAAGVHLVRH
jgi:hypothetical protein